MKLRFRTYAVEWASTPLYKSRKLQWNHIYDVSFWRLSAAGKYIGERFGNYSFVDNWRVMEYDWFDQNHMREVYRISRTFNRDKRSIHDSD